MRVRLGLSGVALLMAMGLVMPIRAQYVDKDEPPQVQQPEAQPQQQEVQQPPEQKPQENPLALPQDSSQQERNAAPTVVPNGAPRRAEGNAIWRDPGDPATLDLAYGIGGRELAPDPNGTYKFLNEDLAGSTPKFEVEDSHGNRWRVKLAEESKPETAATRLLWAAGYFVDTDYYLETMKVEGLSKLQRGANFVDKNGVVHGAQLELKPKSVKKIGDWDWFDNPFKGTREFNGLRIMMALVNNWDLKEANNAIYSVEGNGEEYAISDMGATFGNTGNLLSRSKSKVEDYANSKFIDKINPQSVDFVMRSRPPLFTALNVSYFASRSRMSGIAKGIPRADAKWLGMRLSQLSHDQISDCFRSSGYSPEETEGYTKAVQERIAMLKAL